MSEPHISGFFSDGADGLVRPVCRLRRGSKPLLDFKCSKLPLWRILTPCESCCRSDYRSIELPVSWLLPPAKPISSSFLRSIICQWKCRGAMRVEEMPVCIHVMHKSRAFVLTLDCQIEAPHAHAPVKCTV